MSRKSNKEQRGFTIVELLIATSVFSVLLVGILTSFIKISDLFYKGVSMSKTQEDARTIVKSISDDIQFSATNVDTIDADNNQFVYNSDSPQITNQGAFCEGNHKYSFQIGVHVDGSSSNYGLGRDTIVGGSCVSTAPSSSPAVNMLSFGMQLNKLSVSCQNKLCNVNIHVIYYGGDPAPTGLFISPSGFAGNSWQATDAQCTGSLESTDLCATVDYDSTVLKGTAL